MTPRLPLPDLGAYLREQRVGAQLSLRQLADIAGVSNPYLSQIERGLKRPSAEILQRLSQALQISAETLYVRAGILEAESDGRAPTVLQAIEADPALTSRQRGALADIYTSFVAANLSTQDDGDARTSQAAPPARTTRAATPGKRTTKTTQTTTKEH